MALSAVLLTACEAELDNPIEDGGVYSSGSADLSNYFIHTSVHLWRY